MQSNETSFSSQVPEYKQKKKNIVFILLIVIGIISLVFISQNNTWIRNKQKLSSSTQYPFIDKSSQNNSNVLFFYSLADEQILESNFIIAGGVFPSPDLQHSIVPDTDGKFQIITNTYPDLNIKKLPIEKATFGGWSPDSKKFLYFSLENTPASNIAKYNIYDISSNSSTPLDETIYADQQNQVFFIDNNKLLVQKGILSRNNNVHIYNISDAQKSKEILFENFAFSFNFLPNSTKWLILKSDLAIESSTMSITLADFPDKDGVIIDSGGWADLQPFISVSPDGRYIAYDKKTTVQSTPTTLETTWIYDVLKKSRRELYKGSRPVEWIDNETIVVEDFLNNGSLVAITIDKDITFLQSEFFKAKPISESDRGFLYSSSSYDGQYAIRFFDILSQKSKTIMMTEDLRSSDSSIRYANNKIYFTSKEGKLVETNIYTGEKNVKNFVSKINSKEEFQDFFVSDNIVFYILCSYSNGCNLNTLDLTSRSLSESRKIPESENYIEILGYNKKNNTFRLQESEWTDSSRYEKVYDFGVNDNTSSMLYVERCRANEEGGDSSEDPDPGCRINSGIENYEKIKSENIKTCQGIKIEQGISDSRPELKTPTLVLFNSSYIGCIE